ncbi:hypothetical protein [Aquimarina hainanensis]|uniref:hypothetical protein n=1 Tax=Aquimarina hainanensis TaxID=1578017 RepID=UPI00360F727D
MFHVFFNSKSPKVPANNKKYNEAIAYRNTTQQKYLEDLKSKKLSVDEYYTLTKTLINTSKKQIKSINKELGEINKEHSFRGRNSFHFWIFVFGLVTALFFFSCKSLKDDISRGSTFKFQLVSLSGILVSGFWAIHLLFLTQKDFSQNKYLGLIFVCAILFSAFTYFLVKYYTYKDQIIYKQLSFIERIKKIYFAELAFRARYAERVGEAYKSEKTVRDCIDEFQDDLKQVTSNI